MTSGTTPTVRSLILELARIEDAIRATPTVLPSADGPLNPELVELFEREGDVVAQLRKLRRPVRN